MNFNNYIENFNKTLSSVNSDNINEFIEIMIRAYKDGKFVYIIGNGGSAANASHLAEDLAKGTKSFKDKGKRIKAISLTDNLPFFSAQANDDGYETVFVEQLKTYAVKGDVLVAISGSGNSPNILKAVEWANDNDVMTIGITGFDGGKLKKIAKHSINTNLNDMCTTESIHSVIFHYIIIELHEKLKNLN